MSGQRTPEQWQTLVASLRSLPEWSACGGDGQCLTNSDEMLDLLDEYDRLRASSAGNFNRAEEAERRLAAVRRAVDGGAT